jgi:hypothetical protein
MAAIALTEFSRYSKINSDDMELNQKNYRPDEVATPKLRISVIKPSTQNKNS